MTQWKNIQEAMNYEVSIDGQVRNKNTKKILKGRLCKNGYLQVSIKIDSENRFINRYIHRLVATEWLDNKNNLPEVNHKNGNKLDNNLNNLEWVTASQNQKHRHLIGINKTSNRKVGKFDLNNNLINVYNSIVAAAAAEGCSRVSIDNVLQGKRKTLRKFVWKYLD